VERWWIDTKDKRPENLDVVLCVNEFGGMWIEQYYNGFSGEQPTHWMPLPDPPAGSYEKLNTSEKRGAKL
jgi:hypothetical protein